MKNLSKVLTLGLLISNLAIANTNAYKKINGISNPAEYLSQNQNKETWFAYQVKAQENTTSMCCWNHHDSESKQCHLEKNNSSFGSSNTDGITQNINIYVKISQGAVKNMLSVGDQCKIITGNQKVNWLSDVTQQHSINWLKDISINGNQKAADYAISSLANHHSKQASETLYDVASLNKKNRSSNAVFWLGNSRHDGVNHLQKLYKKLPAGHVKRHINFALSQSKSSQAYGLLTDIAKNDKDTEQRADAYFWLAEQNKPGIEELLLNAVKKDKSHVVREKAIFGLSQVESDKAATALINLAENSKNNNIQEKALFWLAQKSPAKAKKLVLKTLKTTKSESQINNAVFVLSQLSHHSKDEALFSLLTENYSKQVKKQALFWLSQSDNSDTLDRLENLL